MEKQTATEFYTEHLRKMEALLTDLTKLREEGKEQLENFQIKELYDLVEDDEINNISERIVVMLQDISQGL